MLSLHLLSYKAETSDIWNKSQITWVLPLVIMTMTYEISLYKPHHTVCSWSYIQHQILKTLNSPVNPEICLTKNLIKKTQLTILHRCFTHKPTLIKSTAIMWENTCNYSKMKHKSQKTGSTPHQKSTNCVYTAGFMAGYTINYVHQHAAAWPKNPPHQHNAVFIKSLKEVSLFPLKHSLSGTEGSDRQYEHCFRSLCTSTAQPACHLLCCRLPLLPVGGDRVDSGSGQVLWTGLVWGTLRLLAASCRGPAAGRCHHPSKKVNNYGSCKVMYITLYIIRHKRYQAVITGNLPPDTQLQMIITEDRRGRVDCSQAWVPIDTGGRRGTSAVS